MTPWITLKIAESPQPGHQRTSWSDLKSFPVSWTRLPLPSAMSGVHQRRDRVGELRSPTRALAHLVVADRVHEELGPQQHPELAEVDLGHEHLLVAPDDL